MDALNNTSGAVEALVSASYFYIPAYSIVSIFMFVIFVKSFNQKVTSVNKINLKRKVSLLSSLGCLSFAIFYASVNAFGLGIEGQEDINDEFTENGQQIAAAIQSITYAFSASCFFHVAGLWLLLMVNFISSTYETGKSSGKRGVQMRKMKDFEPSKCELLSFIFPGYIGVATVVVINIASGIFEWGLDFSDFFRIIYAFLFISIATYTYINVRVVINAGAVLKNMATSSAGTGTGIAPSDIQQRQRHMLLDLVKRTKTMSYFITLCCLTVGPVCLVIIFSGFTSNDLFTVLCLFFLTTVFLIFPVIVYWSVIRKTNVDKAIKRENEAPSKGTAQTVSDFATNELSYYDKSNRSLIPTSSARNFGLESNPEKFDIAV